MIFLFTFTLDFISLGLALADQITLEQAAAAVRASHNNPTFKADELCLRRSKSWPQLILVGRRLSEGADCDMLEDILALEDGKLVSVQTGGFSWPEETIAKEWSAGNREDLALRWVTEVEWAFARVMTAPNDYFKRPKAPKFTAPAARTVGKKLFVEAWHEEVALYATHVCFTKHRRIMQGKYWSELTQVEVFCPLK